MTFQLILLRLLAAFLTALVISLVAMPAIIQIASLKKLLDEPDNVRKLHSGIIPNLGGIGIFTAFLISFSVWGEAASLESYPFFVASLFMLFLIGIKDDILVISPLKKLGVQILAAFEMVIGGNLVLTNLQGLLGIHHIPWIIGVFITASLFIVLTNSFNLIDGIDGLAGGIGIVISGVLGMWFLLSGFYTMAILNFVLIGALVGFLFYNLHPAQIFMGDTGAMAVGFILVYMVVQFILLNQANPQSEFYINNAPVFALGLLIIPVVDTLRVFTLRVLAGKSPLAADYNHLHHQFIKEGVGQVLTSYYLWIGNLIVVFVAYIFDFLGPNTLLILILLVGFTILPAGKVVHALAVRYVPNHYYKHFPEAKKS